MGDEIALYRALKEAREAHRMALLHRNRMRAESMQAEAEVLSAHADVLAAEAALLEAEQR